ncbi:MAG: FMN-binding protein, partial [Pseudomonadota bacterium]
MTIPRTILLFLFTGIVVLGAEPAHQVAAQSREVTATPFSTDVRTEWLHEVLPEAGEFGEKQGEPPAWPGYRRDPVSRERELVGHAFLSGDVPPVEGGYSGPIDMLIGVDADHEMTGIKILDYVETYRSTKGDFLANRDLLGQFRGKPINDEFQIGRDIDGIAGSTVSVFAVARGARNAARRVAEAYLDYDPADPVGEAREARIVEEMGQYSWRVMLDSGIVRQLEVPLPDEQNIVFSLTYMGHPGLGSFWIGRDAYARAEREASVYQASDEMVLVAVGGSASDRFRYDQLQFHQGDSRSRRVTAERFVPAGDADTGMIEGHADFAGAIVLPEEIDVTRPFTLSYRHLGTSDRRAVRFQPVGLGMRLARNEDVLGEAEIERILRSEDSRLNRFLEDPPWGVASPGKVVALLLVLALALTAFLRKSARLRWITLGATTA